MGLVYTWYEIIFSPKMLLSPIHTPAHDLEVKVTDLEISCLSFASKFLRSHYF